MSSTFNNLTTILNAHYIHEVQIAKSKLELEGVKSYIVDEHLTTTIGTAFIEGYKLQVNTNDVIKAKHLLNNNNK
jgi:hypothetical protein